MEERIRSTESLSAHAGAVMVPKTIIRNRIVQMIFFIRIIRQDVSLTFLSPFLVSTPCLHNLQQIAQGCLFCYSIF